MSIAEPDIGELAATSSVCPGMGSGNYSSIKPVFDFALALALLLPSAPIMLLVAVLVRLGSRGPSIYTQRRLGLGGKVFTIYKIRTMYQDSESRSGATWSVPGDPRVTPVGRFLRFTHIDELPQLINVLLGEMSLVGPRPERPEFLPKLERAMPDYRRRLAVRPGVTGLAQVQQPPDTDLASVRRKLDYDLHYAERISPWLDARIVLATGLKCVGVPFGWIGALLMLPDPNATRERGPGPEALLREAELASKSLV
jgi:lipopolysaccharide/colanic/teichoic acid biosynthesis glycosyltransferase